MSHDTDLVKQEIWESLQDKGNRDAFVESHLSTNIGSQIFSMREARDWSQEKLATEVGMAQPRISVLEGGYDNYSLRTLKRIASAFDVAVVVRFVPFSELVTWVAELSEERLAPVEFANDNLPDTNNSAKASLPSTPHEAARVFFIKNFGTVTENSNFQEYTAHNQITTTANTTHTDLGMGAVFIGAYEYATVARPTIENYLAEPKVNPSTLAIGMTAISALEKEALRG